MNSFQTKRSNEESIFKSLRAIISITVFQAFSFHQKLQDIIQLPTSMICFNIELFPSVNHPYKQFNDKICCKLKFIFLPTIFFFLF